MRFPILSLAAGLLLLIGLVATPRRAFAQGGITATLSGTVLDSSGAVLHGDVQAHPAGRLVLEVELAVLVARRRRQHAAARGQDDRAPGHRRRGVLRAQLSHQRDDRAPRPLLEAKIDEHLVRLVERLPGAARVAADACRKWLRETVVDDARQQPAQAHHPLGPVLREERARAPDDIGRWLERLVGREVERTAADRGLSSAEAMRLLQEHVQEELQNQLFQLKEARDQEANLLHRDALEPVLGAGPGGYAAAFLALVAIPFFGLSTPFGFLPHTLSFSLPLFHFFSMLLLH